MGTSQDELDMQVLEHIYENCTDDRPASIGGLRERFGENDAAATTSSLRTRGLLRADKRMSAGYFVTPAGRAEVEEMRNRRADRGLRRRLCRNRLLRWMDEQGASHAGKRVAREDFDASPDLLPFTDQETEAAAEHLKQHGLIESISADQADHILVWTTDRGRQCLDEGGDVLAFTKMDVERNASQVFNITGSGNTVAAAIGNDNEVTASLSTFNSEAAAQFAEAVRQATPALGLDADRVDALVADVQQTEDPTRAQRATALLQTMVVGTTTGTLGQVLGVLGASALGIGT